MCVFCDAQRIVNSSVLGRGVHPSNRTNILSRNPGDFFGLLRRVVFHLRADGVKALGVFVDKFLVIEAFADDHVRQCRQQPDIRPGLEL